MFGGFASTSFSWLHYIKITILKVFIWYHAKIELNKIKIYAKNKKLPKNHSPSKHFVLVLNWLFGVRFMSFTEVGLFTSSKPFILLNIPHVTKRTRTLVTAF